MQFVIIARDGVGPDVLARRVASREAHLANMSRLKTNKNFIIGGPTLNDKGDMNGSVIIVEFSEREALDSWLANDPYVTNKVWETVEVLPYRVAKVD
ncbi:MAG TPA: YciI family protein [Alphaproteobacteria bacterium]|nr:YciI family protein [Alphaproteobacteria bacterium]